jgi:hypothetical protein
LKSFLSRATGAGRPGSVHNRADVAAGGGDGVAGWGLGRAFGCGWRRGGGRFGFDEFDLGVGVAGFLEFGLDQGSVLGVVDQFEVVGELGIKANGEELVGERNRMCLEQVASGERG